MVDIQKMLDEQKLTYITCRSPGISRQKVANGFIYLDKNGNTIVDDETLGRIKRLVIPPAWENVWIASQANAHLQATGIDQAGRKQYRYHPHWSSSRNQSKYYRLLEFGKKLPQIRRRLHKDLKRRTLDEKKVLAIAVSLMQETLIRIGNESYKQLYGSYGLSTLRNKHAKVDGSQLKLVFKGKKGVLHDIALKNKQLIRLVKKCKDIPGQELFQYYTKSSDHKPIDSGMVNGYIKEITCCDFTTKDFRTWAGTLEALRSYAKYDFAENQSQRKKNSICVLDEVCARLGNTRNVCKKYYVFPALVEAYEKGDLDTYLKKLKKAPQVITTQIDLTSDEKVLLNFLKAVRRKNK